MTVSHWPTTLIGPGGESEIVSHFVESIFSGSWVMLELGKNNQKKKEFKK
jgi:hypothetical protein